MKWSKLFKVGDRVIIVRTNKQDLHKEGIIVGWHLSYCDVQILNPDGTPKLNPQNNKPIVNKHPYGHFKKKLPFVEQYKAAPNEESKQNVVDEARSTIKSLLVSNWAENIPYKWIDGEIVGDKKITDYPAFADYLLKKASMI